MAIDNLTYVMITVAITLAIVALMLAVTNRRTDSKLRNVVRNMSLMQHSTAARDLCKSIREKHPELCVGIDYTLKGTDEQVEIDEWNHAGPRPDR